MGGEFIFHNVGHGLFYSGQISNNSSEKLNFIFDCGSKSKNKIEERVNKYVADLGKLDMLFISHLHSDHINGIPYLLDKVKCKRVFMPYFTPIERLCFIVESLNELNEDGTNINKIDDEIIKFIKSPHNYFLEKNKDIEVVYINNDNSDLDSFDITIKRVTFIASNRINLENSFNSFWDFILYNRKSDSKKIDKFKKKVLDKFDFFCYSNLEEIIKKDENLNIIREIYSDVFGKNKFNDYGLMLIHKPSEKDKFYFKDGEKNCLKENRNTKICCLLEENNELLGKYKECKECKKITSSLLTGDRPLKLLLDNKINNELKDVCVFQVPHHGSKTGWKKSVLNNFNESKCKKAIMCFGNLYKLPNGKVKKDLENNKFGLIEVKDNDYRYEIKLI